MGFFVLLGKFAEVLMESFIIWLSSNLKMLVSSAIGSGSLVINSLLEEDSGVYECMARNIIGTAISNTGHLNVRSEF